MSAKKNNIPQLDKYLRGKLDNKAMHQIEREAQDDAFLNDALDGYENQGIMPSVNLGELKSRLGKRVAENTQHSVLLWRMLPIAACLLLIVGAGYWLLKPKEAVVQYTGNIKPTVGKPEEPAVGGVLEKPTRAVPQKKPGVSKPSYIVKNNAIRHEAALQEVLKRVQALTVDSGGRIATRNSGAITSRLNGKDYTGGTVAQAVKNLPKDIVEKTQVVDDYGDQVNKTGNGNKTFILTGKVLDAKTKEELYGTAIGTGGKRLVQADTNGMYKLDVSDTATISFNMIGYLSQSIKLKPGQKSLNVALKEDGKPIAETVIRGYVKHSKDIANGASYMVTGKEVQDNPVGNVDQLMQGKVAGLNIQNNLASNSILIPLSGTVTDKYGAAIPGATVYSGGKAIAQTDVNGRYRAMVFKDSSLTVSNLGYRSASSKLLPGHNTLDVKLAEQTSALAEVSIHGYVKRSREQTTGASYIITGKEKPCKENARFKRRFFNKISIAEKYVTQHANRDALTISDGKFYRALKFITKHAPSTIKADKTANAGYADLDTFAKNKRQWLNWYESNKCNNLK